MAEANGSCATLSTGDAGRWALAVLPMFPSSRRAKEPRRWRSLVAKGKDPIKERDAIARAASRVDTSLRVVAEEAFEVRKAELKGDGKAGRWFSPLELHVLPNWKDAS